MSRLRASGDVPLVSARGLETQTPSCSTTRARPMRSIGERDHEQVDRRFAPAMDVANEAGRDGTCGQSRRKVLADAGLWQLIERHDAAVTA